MRFAKVHAQEDFEFHTHDGEETLEQGEDYGIPEVRAEKLVSSNPALYIKGAYTVPDEDVGARFCEKVNGGSEDGYDYEGLVEDSSNSEIEEAVQDFDSVDNLEKLLEVEKELKDRKGAKEAINNRIDELEG